jgi:threonine dehydrogenase-like Zn-dependent dehydrogenase
MATIKDGKGTFILAAFDSSCQLKKTEVGRPDVGPTDISIDIQYCGMCHSDIHACNGDWHLNKYPIGKWKLKGVSVAVIDHSMAV